MNYNEEYFFIEDAGSSRTFYLKGAEENYEFTGCKYIKQPECPLDIYMNEPVTRSLTLADVYMLNATRHIFSEKVKNAIQELNPEKTDFIPTDLHIKSNDYKGYFIMNCYNKHEVMDLEQSEYRRSAKGGILSIQKLVLDAKKIENIPLNERLVITLAESVTYKIFHESVIDRIGKTEPKGCHAISLDAWNSDLMFQL